MILPSRTTTVDLWPVGVNTSALTSTRSARRVSLDPEDVRAPLLQPTAALISKADRQIDLVVTGFETIPKIEAQQWEHDLSQVESRSNAY